MKLETQIWLLSEGDCLAILHHHREEIKKPVDATLNQMRELIQQKVNAGVIRVNHLSRYTLHPSEWFWEIVDQCRWDNGVVPVARQQELSERVVEVIVEQPPDRRDEFLDQFHQAIAHLVERLTGEPKEIRQTLAEYIVGLGSDRYVECYLEALQTGKVTGVNAVWDYTFLDGVTKAIDSTQSREERQWFWEFIASLRQIRYAEDWLEDSSEILHTYPIAEQGSFKRSFQTLRRELELRVKRVMHLYPLLQQVNLDTLYRVIDFVITEGETLYRETWYSPEKLIDYLKMEIGERRQLFDQVPRVVESAPAIEVPVISVPISLLSPALSLGIVKAFNQGQSISDLADRYKVDPLAIEAILRLIWMASER